MLTGVTDNLKERCITFGKLLQQRFPDKPVFYFSYQPVGIISLESNKLQKVSSLPSPLYGFCGIAQPELFQKTLATQDISMSGFLPLKDHQPFTPSLIKKITGQANAKNAQGLITTEKDLIKLQKGTFELPCFGLKMKVQPDLAFKDYLEEKLSIFTQLCHSSHRSAK